MLWVSEKAFRKINEKKFQTAIKVFLVALFFGTAVWGMQSFDKVEVNSLSYLPEFIKEILA